MRLLRWFCLSMICLASISISAQEYSIKLGFVYNFAQYGTWHHQSPAPFCVCITERDLSDQAKVLFSDKKINGQLIDVQLVSLGDNPITPCQELYVTKDTQHVWMNELTRYSPHVMLIGESDSFIREGGHIRFFIAGGKVRFEIAPKAMHKAQISMSSKVLRLGLIADEEGR